MVSVTAGMVFAIIFALIVVGAILAFALPQLQNLFGLGTQAQVAKAVKDIQALTNDVYSLSQGSTREYTLLLPGPAKVCFIDKGDPRPRIYSLADREKWWNPDEIVTNSLLANGSAYHGSSLWVYNSPDEVGQGIKVDRLVPIRCADPPCSFCAKGGARLLFENIGRSVGVSAE